MCKGALGQGWTGMFHPCTAVLVPVFSASALLSEVGARRSEVKPSYSTGDGVKVRKSETILTRTADQAAFRFLLEVTASSVVLWSVSPVTGRLQVSIPCWIIANDRSMIPRHGSSAARCSPWRDNGSNAETNVTITETLIGQFFYVQNDTV